MIFLYNLPILLLSSKINPGKKKRGVLSLYTVFRNNTGQKKKEKGKEGKVGRERKEKKEEGKREEQAEKEKEEERKRGRKKKRYLLYKKKAGKDR